MVFLKLFLLFLCEIIFFSSKLSNADNSTYLPRIMPFLPQIAPSPLVNRTFPKLSGKCVFNFTSSESLMKTTAIDCYGPSAPLLQNAICCPQVEAALTILIAQSSRQTNLLSLNDSTSKHCLSDFSQLLAFHGVTFDVTKLCSIQPGNLTQGSCPVNTVGALQNIVDSNKILEACKNIDPVMECCEQTCQSAVLFASSKLSPRAPKALKLGGISNGPEFSFCKDIVLRWMASKLDYTSAKDLLRRITNCNVNKVCPLAFPSAKSLALQCEGKVVNMSSCCNEMDSYISHMRKQTLITNIQAMHCADSLGMKLRILNVSSNVFKLCHVTLKDFSLQVQSKEYGCLLPSMPLDATLDKNSAVSFTCDLNDGILAPWDESVSLCNQSVVIPTLPAPASGTSGIDYGWSAAKLVIVAAILGLVM